MNLRFLSDKNDVGRTRILHHLEVGPFNLTPKLIIVLLHSFKLIIAGPRKTLRILKIGKENNKQ